MKCHTKIYLISYEIYLHMNFLWVIFSYEFHAKFHMKLDKIIYEVPCEGFYQNPQKNFFENNNYHISIEISKEFLT